MSHNIDQEVSKQAFAVFEELWIHSREVTDNDDTITYCFLKPKFDNGIKEFTINLAQFHGLIEEKDGGYFLTRQGVVVFHGVDGQSPYERFEGMCPVRKFLLPVTECKLNNIEEKFAKRYSLG